MSTPLSKAIYARLSGTESLTGDALAAQGALASLLSVDPDTSRPAVFFGNKNKTQVWVSGDNVIPISPCITFRQSGGSSDRRFQLQTGVVERVLYDFEIWEEGASGTRISDIAEQMERLLDIRRGVVLGLPLESGRLFAMQAFSPLSVLYDAGTHAWAGLVRYEFLEVRY